ncbi:hypothetical protein ACFPRL_27180 [Pseudoclavibacter helvolus]
MDERSHEGRLVEGRERLVSDRSHVKEVVCHEVASLPLLRAAVPTLLAEFVD